MTDWKGKGMRRERQLELRGGQAPDPVPNLVARARQGEEAAFRALFEAHKERVYSLFLRIAGSRALAEDLTREAFLKAFRSISTLRDDRAFQTLLNQVVGAEILAFLREEQVERTLSLRCDSAQDRNKGGITRAMPRRREELLIPAARLAP